MVKTFSTPFTRRVIFCSSPNALFTNPPQDFLFTEEFRNRTLSGVLSGTVKSEPSAPTQHFQYEGAKSKDNTGFLGGMDSRTKCCSDTSACLKNSGRACKPDSVRRCNAHGALQTAAIIPLG